MREWTELHGLSEVLETFDVFLIDQYGVLHNGTDAYPLAVQAFNQLVAHPNKKVFVLSNTPRRAVAVEPKLKQMGFATGFDGAVTGGEQAWQRFNGSPRRAACAAVITYDFEESVTRRKTNATSIFHALDHISVGSIDQADFILVEGPQWLYLGPDKTPQTQRLSFLETGELDECLLQFLFNGLERKLPLFCTNPDLVAVKTNGQIHHMGGKIADFYEQLGGQVVRFGKPDVQHFETCMELAGVLTSQRHRVVHIGDSLLHDIQGANAAQIASIFIARGIHAPELALDPRCEQPSTTNCSAASSSPLDATKLNALFQAQHTMPTFVLSELRW